MASFIPSVYHPIDLGIGDIGNILLQARKQSRDDEARRAELLMRQEAADRENARLDEQMRHTSELENHQRQVDVANTLPKIKAMLTPGDPSYDPETGMSLARAYGINLSATQPTAPTAPEKPTLQAQPANPMFGPKLPPQLQPDVSVQGTQLDPVSEARYQAWKKTLPERLQYEGDYDLRGFFQKNPTWSPDAPEAHMTDEFKLPNHQTFSNESRYFNDKTRHLGGEWNGNAYVPFDSRFKRSIDESSGDAVVANDQFYDFDRADANKAAMGKYAGQLADYQKQLAHPRAPTYSGTSPVGPISIDPNAAVAAREERLRQQQEQMAPLAGAVDEKMQPVVFGMIKSGAPLSEVAKFVSEYQKEAHQDATKATYNLTAEDQRRHQKEMERIGWAAANSRDRQQNDRSEDKYDTTIVRDEKGQPIGYVPTGKGGAQGFATRDADYSRGEQMLQGLLTDIEQNGTRVMSPEAVQRRAALHKNAIIGVATVSPLGKTDEAQKLEAASIGPSGAPDMHDKTGMLMGANPEAIRRKLEELRTQRERYRAQTLIPLEERPARTMPRQGGQAQRRQPSQNEQRADTLKSGGKRKSLDDLAAEHGL